jgi:hypothetical protein
MIHPKLRKLHGLLQKALELELFTIPPYLTALYSIQEGANRASVEILQSVVMEEMLHAALVSNIMNAVGASPQVQVRGGTSNPRRVDYPAQAPHVKRPLVIGLLPFSELAVRGFAQIELPENRTRWTTGAAVYSIGQLYDRIRNQLIAVTDELDAGDVFTGARRLQLSAKDYYGGGGGLTVVDGLDSALAAIDEIAQQGEGRLHSNLTGDEARFEQPKEVAHYYRFNQILERRFYDRDDDVCRPTGRRLIVDWKAVRPLGALDPKVKLATPPGIMAVLDAFVASYAELLMALHDAFNGKKAKLTAAVPLMQHLKNQAIEVMRIDIGGGKTCPPPFWFMQS